ncbi:nose resistant to fluoxetine protein 6-like [Leguminivora glycinivorella]|uniref:nose resistant to fluoxetine protein 6-like n=1 Tax=Leguminivora glycinivorella TaxID=1035111 RepID=UPI0020102AB4|nr:nose resistant to fluoxetine protein 6-like [Leguminivora glycinivorella]
MVRWVFVILLIVGILKVSSSENLYDDHLYQSVLDNVTCQRHLQEMQSFPFFDASGGIPQSITLGGQGSLGNYHQCLSITQQIPNDTIIGKYCMIGVPLQQSGLSPPAFDPGAILGLNRTLFELINMDENGTDIEKVLQFERAVRVVLGHGNFRALPPGTQGGLEVKVAVCLPRSCTTYEAIGRYTDRLNVSYSDQYCRLPGDKVFSTVDYIGVVTIVILGTLTAISTTYDLYITFFLEKAPAETNKLLTSFSVYTNTRRLFTFSKSPGSIDCLDGMRSLSILWVVIGHTFTNIFSGTTINLLDAFKWTSSSKATWFTAAVLSVDTFFMMSGLLVVYTTVKKMTPMSLVKNIHLFYLHRLLRMFPLLAAVVLFQASLFHHSADGPNWPTLSSSIQNCRDWWWSALLHVQNYVNVTEICLDHTWYLSVDTQLQILSPLVLFWVLRGRLSAWIGLACGLAASIICTTTYTYIKSYTAVSMLGFGSNIGLISDYFKHYYVNTLTRSPPFVVGMLLGYLLHVWRESPRRIPKWLLAAGWLSALAIGSGMIYCNNPAVEFTQFWANFLNSYMRGLWAMAVGWVVFACAAGYGGPINWFLSLTMWKVLARISYALYLIHYPIQFIIRGQSEVPYMFSLRNVFYLFYTDISLSLMLAIALCVLVDAPFSTIQKILLQGKSKQPPTNGHPPPNGVSSSTEVLVTVNK